MAMVGTKSNLNMLAPQAAANGSNSLAKPAAKTSSPSSSSSSDFANLLSPKKTSEQKTFSREPSEQSQPKQVQQNRKSVEPKRDEQSVDQANWPRQPKSEIVEKTPGRLDGSKVDETRGALNRPEVQAPDAQARVEKRELDESVDNLAHRQALQSLLKKMKDEFGLDAEQVVEAFGSLTPQELMQPPEASLDKLIQSLPLSPEQQQQAKLYFQQMLKETASTDMAGYLKSSQRQLSLEVVSRKEAREREIQRAVEQMQMDFFSQPQNPQNNQMQAPVAASKYKMQAANTSAQQQSPKMAAPVPFMVDSMPTQMAAAELPAPPFAPELANPLDQPATNSIAPKMMPKMEIPAGEEVLIEEPIATESAEVAELPQMFDSEMNELLQALDIPETDLVSATAKGGAAEAAPAPASQVAAAASMNLNQESHSEDDRGGNREKAESWSPQVNQAANRPGQPVNGMKPEAFMIKTQPTPTDNAKNVKEVVNRVQFLAQKGGGEMKVTMSPEGLGEVTMKVAVAKGQVNVEMITESREVKKLLEHGLGDLKATLAANNLKVDQIRVETPSDISRQLTQNHDEAQRQFAQQFMEQFRQDNNDWRRGFYDIGGAKSYPGQKEEAEGGPAVNASQRRSNSSRRLDLVA